MEVSLSLNRVTSKEMPHNTRLTIQPLLVSMLVGAFAVATTAQEWTQFRGPNGSGISDSTNLPVEFGPDKNCLWKTLLPAGHSSPVIGRDRIFLTGFEGEKLFRIGFDRKTGKLLWKQECYATPAIVEQRFTSVLKALCTASEPESNW